MLPFETKVCDYAKIQGTMSCTVSLPYLTVITCWQTASHGSLFRGRCRGGYLLLRICLNVQPGIGIDYATGDNWAESSGTYQSTEASVAEKTPAPQPETDTAVQITPELSAPQETQQTTYVLNTNTMKFHYPTCSSVDDMKEKNKQIYTGSRDEVINMGYVPCKRCNP